MLGFAKHKIAYSIEPEVPVVLDTPLQLDVYNTNLASFSNVKDKIYSREYNVPSGTNRLILLFAVVKNNTGSLNQEAISSGLVTLTFKITRTNNFEYSHRNVCPSFIIIDEMIIFVFSLSFL